MKLLILGGTRFLGRHLVEAAQARGHVITLFNRGLSNPNLYPDVEHLRGDRDGDLSALEGRRWDAVIDPSGYVPRIVRASAQLLADAVEHYTFISSISVYPDATIHNLDETAEVARLDDETTEDVAAAYGGLKALCEQAAEAALPGRVLNVRAGLIVGPHDPTDRFTYWPVRVALGGDVLAPGMPERQVQFIDARDLADWIIHMIETLRPGTYNATGPADRLTMGDTLEACRATTGSNATFTWVSDDFLLENEVTPFTEMPLWVPEAYNGLLSVNIEKALAAGLAFRPLADTIRDTLAWNATRDEEFSNKGLRLRGGMMLEREAELLAKWRKRR
ncbi:MAG: NAD-dependent epimerase/dehydratase family protein [Chloroflexi bacterium]|nr:NAD-dependent epimerase/dehydratase family protein [Chloroflexota bacterium]